MRQITQKPRLVKIEKKIILPSLKFPVKLRGYYAIYFELIKGNIKIVDDTRRTYDGNIEGWATIIAETEGTVVDIYQYRVESMVFPSKLISSRTRWIYRNGHWEAAFTHTFNNIHGRRETCYCYSSNIDECNCNFVRDEED